MSIRNVAVIHDGASNFLGFSGRRWVAGGDGDIFEGTYPNAVRLARTLAREPGRRVFVSKSYGYVDQEDREILPNGDVLPAVFPNR